MGDKDFFLSPDDAMTMGDIDFMRTTKRTRRTFPKTLKNKDGFAVENNVSSLEARNGDFQSNNGSNGNTFSSPSSYSFQPQAAPAPQAPAPQAQAETSSEAPAPEAAPSFQQSPTDRRKSDTSMDMFRNMAKKMRR